MKIIILIYFIFINQSFAILFKIESKEISNETGVEKLREWVEENKEIMIPRLFNKSFYSFLSFPSVSTFKDPFFITCFTEEEFYVIGITRDTRELKSKYVKQKFEYSKINFSSYPFDILGIPSPRGIGQIIYAGIDKFIIKILIKKIFYTKKGKSIVAGYSTVKVTLLLNQKERKKIKIDIALIEKHLIKKTMEMTKSCSKKKSRGLREDLYKVPDSERVDSLTAEQDFYSEEHEKERIREEEKTEAFVYKKFPNSGIRAISMPPSYEKGPPSYQERKNSSESEDEFSESEDGKDKNPPAYEEIERSDHLKEDQAISLPIYEEKIKKSDKTPWESSIKDIKKTITSIDNSIDDSHIRNPQLFLPHDNLRKDIVTFTKALNNDIMITQNAIKVANRLAKWEQQEIYLKKQESLLKLLHKYKRRLMKEGNSIRREEIEDMNRIIKEENEKLFEISSKHLFF